MTRHTVSEPFRQPYAADSQRILDCLRLAGIGPESLFRDWNVLLWSVRVKGETVKFKLHPLGEINEQGIRDYLQSVLGNELVVRVKIKPVTQCCHNACQGCLFGNPQKREEWASWGPSR